MFWRERTRENRVEDGGPPCGQVRVLVVGDSGELNVCFKVFSFSFYDSSCSVLLIVFGF